MTPTVTIVERLAKLLGDEARLEGKIRDTTAALSLIKKQISESLVRHYIATTEEEVKMPEGLMKEEQSYERLLQALQEMKNEIVRQIRPVEEQIIQANVDHLRQTFDHESKRLGQCLEEIDQKIMDCRQSLERYKQIHSILHGLNEKLSLLGAEPLVVPDHLPTNDVEEIVKERIEHLRFQGKLELKR